MGIGLALVACAALLAIACSAILVLGDHDLARAQAIAAFLAAGAAAALAVLTIFYVTATQAMVREMADGREADGRARRDAVDAQRRRLLRGALVEQVENCRVLLGSDPSKGSSSAATTADWRPAMADLLLWLRETELPPDLAAYLMWLVGSARHLHGLFRDECRLASMEVAPHMVPLSETKAWDRWVGELEDVQVIAELLVGYSSTDPALADVHRQFATHPWTAPQIRPTGDHDWRAALHLQPLDIVVPPPWPAGDAYEFAHHSRRGSRAMG